MIIKRKKSTRYRGSQTHGSGAKKKRRGAGNRGGRGMAGTGKRADQKKPTILKLYGNAYFGKRGFKIPKKIKKDIKAINLDDLQRLINKNNLKEDINLNELGYDKILSSGNLSKKYNIACSYCSKKAKEKIEKLGGTVNASI
ncbi:MAG: uL15m family ribosomal protein [archaeon]